MKQVLVYFMMLLALTMSFPAALADEGQDDTQAEVELEAQIEASEDDVSTQTEIEAMTSGEGAKLRLLQLQREIERRILHANEVIVTIQGNSTNSTAELETIVTELEGLVDDIDAALAELEEGGTNQAAVETFLEIKADAKSLVKEFRDTAKPLLKSTAEVKKRLESIDREKLQAYNDEISEARREFNAVRVEALLKLMGKTDAELVAGIRDGSISYEEAVKDLKDTFETLSEEERATAARALREELTKRRVARTDQLEKFVENAQERVVVRLEERAQKLEDNGNTEAAAALRAAQERLEAKSEIRSEKLTELREREKEREKIREEIKDGVREVRSEIKTERDEIRTEIRERIKDGEVRSVVRDRVKDEAKAEVCAAIAYGGCNAERVGQKCTLNGREASGYECDKVEGTRCYGTCRADDSSSDDNAASEYGACNAERVGEKCDPDNEATGYECDRVDGQVYGVCRGDN